MNLRHYQRFLLNKLEQHDKVFIFWEPTMGLSYLLHYYMYKYIHNHNNKDIFVLSHNTQQLLANRSNMFGDINHISNNNCIVNTKKDSIEFINDNYASFYTISQPIEYTLYRFKPDIIIVDDIRTRSMNHLEHLERYIINNKCKIIFTSYDIQIDIINYFDYLNDYYINILPHSYNKTTDNGYYEDKLRQLSHKPKHLLDYYNTRFEREEKLKRIKKISDGI